MSCQIFLSLIIAILCSQALLAQTNEEPVPVDSVNLSQYIGLWYEIAKIPNRFQKKCDKNTIANYSFREDGRIDVINTCIQSDGSKIIAKGIAKVSDKKTNAKLKVSFVRFLGISLFWGDYWILGLANDYHYAVVGDGSRKYGWILGRKTRLSPEDWEEVIIILKRQGYDPSLFENTIQEYPAESFDHPI